MKKEIFKTKIVKFLKLNYFSFEDLKIVKFKIFGKYGILNILIKNSNLNNIKKFNCVKKKLFDIFKNKKVLKETYDFKSYFVFKNKNELKVNKIYFYKKKIENYFVRNNFVIYEGKEIENIENNFTFLRSYKGHPSRSKKDTFYIKNIKNALLRTHMTCLQKKHIKNNNISKMIFSGKVYRKDKGSKHLESFHQIDALILNNKRLDFLFFKNIFEGLLLYIFKKKIYIRYRNSYFPFTLPSYEIDIKKKINDEWIEIGGAGEVHEDISENKNGFAFGFGLERIIMIKNNLKNIGMI